MKSYEKTNHKILTPQKGMLIQFHMQDYHHP